MSTARLLGVRGEEPPLHVPQFQNFEASPRHATGTYSRYFEAPTQVECGAACLRTARPQPTTTNVLITPRNSVGRSATELNEAIFSAGRYFESVRQKNGMWRGDYVGSVFQNALMLVSERAASPTLSREQLTILRQILQTQNVDGGFPLHFSGPSSTATTQMVVLILQNLHHDQRNLVQRDCEQRLQQAMQFALKIPDQIFSPWQFVSWLYRELYGGVDDIWNVPFFSDGLNWFFKSGADDVVQPAFRVILPAISLLYDSQAIKQNRLVRALSPLSEVARRQMEAKIYDSQDQDGGWLSTTMATSLMVAALATLRDDPRADAKKRELAMTRGLDFLAALRSDNHSELTTQSHYRSEVWDSAFVLQTLFKMGRLDTKTTNAGVEFFVRCQRADGRWSFSEGGKASDNDTTAAVLMFLCEVFPTLSADRRVQVQSAIRRATDSLLHNQQEGGGYAAFDDDAALSYEKRIPGVLEQVAVDSTDASVTARVLQSLFVVRQLRILDDSYAGKIDDVRVRAVDFFRRARMPNGAWWSRWSGGYLTGLGYIPLALRAAGLRPGDSLFIQGRETILKLQNSDGGFGEDVQKEGDGRRLYRAASTPGQTAYAMLGLMASSQAADPQLDAALERSAHYLLSTQKNGSWSDPKPIYTMFTGFEYYHADLWTTWSATQALSAYEHYRRDGLDKAVQALIR